jgi:hypothetical protein
MAPTLIHIGYHKTGTKWLRGGLFLNKTAGYHWIDKDTAAVRRLIRAHPLTPRRRAATSSRCSPRPRRRG